MTKTQNIGGVIGTGFNVFMLLLVMTTVIAFLSNPATATMTQLLAPPLIISASYLVLAAVAATLN